MGLVQVAVQVGDLVEVDGEEEDGWVFLRPLIMSIVTNAGTRKDASWMLSRAQVVAEVLQEYMLLHIRWSMSVCSL